MSRPSAPLPAPGACAGLRLPRSGAPSLGIASGRGLLLLVLAAVALAVLRVPAAAAPHQAPQHLTSLAIAVTNHRPSPVVMLSFAAEEDTGDHANLLKHPIEPGATVTLTIKAKPGQCSFTVVGRFADGTDFSGAGLDLCTDHKLVLVD